MQNIDANWAWEPFVPSPEKPWSLRLAAHLYRRMGFAGSASDLETAFDVGLEGTLEHFFHENASEKTFEQQADSLARTILATGAPEKLSAAWVYRLLHTPNQLLEKATLFWHGHFATSAAKVQSADLMWQQCSMLRQHALGSFSELVQAIAKDPAMLIYLDSATNRKTHPNENFARELMELFCLGEGNYSEQDVQELARCFTGWEIKNNGFRKNRYQQDRNSKKLLGHQGNFDGEEAIQIVLEQERMPYFICGKLVRFFVSDQLLLEDSLLAPLAEELRENGTNIARVMQRILGSNLMFSEHAVACKIRSPVELLVGLLRSLEASTNTLLLAQGLRTIGQGLFYPPNVKGWDGGRTWINSSTLLGRANLIDRILHDKSTRFGGESSLKKFFESKDLEPEAVLPWVNEHLFARPLGDATIEELQSELGRGQDDWDSRLRRLLHLCFSLPEFQLG